MNLGWQELLIVLVLAVLLFGGTKLAGLGRASGKAIREFKEETEGLSAKKKADEAAAVTQAPAQPQQPAQPQPQQPVEGEVVDPTTDNA
ncbi:twin-arginine translocase TatA/TatE family subunit [Propionibacterium australiense]|uniref:Sec-independent protein translocase protein TatA n=1 Tax=Propionibacterium australiense TaxID=119981 RepID=A0A383S8W0_9ACTN|nr:twin-arginine translocase TatA/TatE family subunit [Propionibacterium australiense]RLP06606.1 twin-arginine translocase TatA/TatE family subunit [Propionibacterium australiense]SYZ34430.1 Sec-independent protein translocase protein TatA/E [Propionibacterium australiense]VEH89874.1 Sec-independent protein translocase protein TatAd [Propionibacterium australiense]